MVTVLDTAVSEGGERYDAAHLIKKFFGSVTFSSSYTVFSKYRNILLSSGLTLKERYSLPSLHPPPRPWVL